MYPRIAYYHLGLLDMLASGMTEDDILRDYPYLEKADFPAVYAYASQAGRQRVLR
jgi:uncharacterized protein (DUF433 family)